MESQSEFDVFLCHDSEDKPEIEKIARQLKEIGIVPWLDKWELRPGFPWRRILEEQLGQVRSAAVFVGSSGTGPWQDMELDTLLNQFARRSCPVVPVLLYNSPQKPDLPIFLQNMGWVDFRQQDVDPIQQLRWGMTGQKPDSFGIDKNFSQGTKLIFTEAQSDHEKQALTLVQLEKLLSSEKWKEADQQTKEIIFFTNNRKSLAVSDIRKLSQELLQQIDILWTRSSDGQYGLSLQKKIWQDCLKQPKVLGIFSSKKEVDESEALIRFGERVGWREKGCDRWLGYGDLNFSSQPPIGCFPCTRRWLNAGWNKTSQQFSTLMAQIK